MQGAWEASFDKWIFETFGLFDLETREAVLNDTPQIRISIKVDGSCSVIEMHDFNSDVLIIGRR